MTQELTTYQPTQAEIRRQNYSQIPGLIDNLSNPEKLIYRESIQLPIRAIADAELIKNLNILLPRIAKDMGYSFKDMNELQNLIVRLAQVLKNYYSNLTLQSLKLAFELCLIGELDRYLPKKIGGEADRSHYNNFGLDYICKILNAYKSRRGEVLDRIEAKAPVKQDIVSAEEKEKYRKRTKIDCILCYWYFKYHNRLPDISPFAEMLYYNLLAEAGLADEIEVTEVEQRQIWQRVANNFARKGMVSELAEVESKGLDIVDKQYSHHVNSLARRKALINTFRRMQIEEIQITDYIR